MFKPLFWKICGSDTPLFFMDSGIGGGNVLFITGCTIGIVLVVFSVALIVERVGDDAFCLLLWVEREKLGRISNGDGAADLRLLLFCNEL